MAYPTGCAVVGKSFGNAPAAPPTPTSRNNYDPTTSVGLVNISVRDGELAAAAAAAEQTIKTGIRSDVTFGNGHATLTKDVRVVDRRSQKQKDADERIRWKMEDARLRREAEETKP